MEFETRIKKAIRAIPRGKVASYSQIAALAGNHRAARQVVRVLHTSSEKDRLPWHRVINSRGAISLARGRGFEKQKRLLLQEGVSVSRLGRIDLEEFQWEPLAPASRAAQQFLRAISLSPTKPPLSSGRTEE